MGRPLRVLMDVDTGVDDALALLLAARSPLVDVVGVTCVAGNAGLDAVVANTLRVLSVAGVTGVPVAAGADRPLLGEPRDATHVHGGNGLADVVLPEPQLDRSDLHAVELMRSVLTHSPGGVVVVALAPLTNLALLLRTHPDVAPSIARVVMMGGAVDGGNATAVAEFNTWHDPEAAAIVLSAGVPVTMYGLDVFYGPAVDSDGIAALEDSPDAAAQLAGRLLRYLSARAGGDPRTPQGRAASLGDAGALCALIDPDGMRTEPLPVRVSLAEGLTRGQTVVDRGQVVDVALDVDGDRYVELFLRTLASRSAS